MEGREKLADSVMLLWTQGERYRAGALLADPSEFTFSFEMQVVAVAIRLLGSDEHRAGVQVCPLGA
jgi:hypothetical protein